MNKIEIVHQVYERLDKKIPMKDLEKIFELFKMGKNMAAIFVFIV